MDQEQITLFASIFTAFIYVVDFVIRVVLLIYIPKNRKPTAAMSWLLLIFIAPILGTILFFVIGNTKLSKKRMAAQRQINLMLQRYTTNLRRKGLVASVRKPHDIRAKLAETLTSLAPTKNNSLKVISGYDNLIEDIARKINGAKEYVYVEFFAIAMDDATEPFFQALENAIKRGVIVRVLFDTLGSRKYPNYKKMQQRLTTMGAKWHKMLPIDLRRGRYNRPDLRNHRKIVVIDNTDGFIGSLNMIDKTYHRKDDISYLELAVHFQGPSVNEAAAVFASDWYAETGVFLKHFMKNSLPAKRGTSTVQIVPSGPSYTYPNNLKLFSSFIQSARKSIVITNPYLVPDESLLSALTSAAQRGLRVSVLNSDAMDQWMVGHAQRSYYEELLRAGVQIYLYKKPQLVHEKFMAIDDEIGIIGSSNLDIRSFELDLECTVIAYDGAVARKLRKHHDAFLQNSRQIHLETWRKRSVWQSFLDSIARLTSALQ